MKMNGHIHKILANYVSDNPATKANLARILMHGKLATHPVQQLKAQPLRGRGARTLGSWKVLRRRHRRSWNVGLARPTNFANMPPNARISHGSDDHGQ
jgi:hypothetical protein